MARSADLRSARSRYTACNDTLFSCFLLRSSRADQSCPLPHPETLMKLLIIVCLIAIVVSLGSGLFHLVNDQGQSKRMVKALTVRIALSVALFILLLIAWWQGMIQPHGLGQ